MSCSCTVQSNTIRDCSQSMKIFAILFIVSVSKSPFSRASRTDSGPESLIIGGRDAPFKSWPWQVGLISSYGIFCGGTLIDYDVVITAAHCLDGSRKFNLKVVAGEYNRYFYEGYEQYIPVKSYFIHPNYQHSFLHGYDIAILFLERNATSSFRVRPINAVANKRFHYTKCDCHITGWGIQSIADTGSGYLAVTLQQARIDIISNSKCNSRRYWDGLIKPTNICAFFDKTAACEGDSGGPLVCKINNQYILVGVTSWGSASCMSYPTVFVDISKFRTWIFGKIEQYRLIMHEIKFNNTKISVEMNIFS